MSTKKRVLVLFGTRPEVIKLAPVVHELRSRPGEFTTIACSTGQHREMLDQAMSVFKLTADLDLNLMTPGQTLAGLTSLLFKAIDKAIDDTKPDAIIVQGDTTSAFVGGMCGFYRRIAVGHVEAGLRTGDLARPFPEEANRQLTDRLAGLLFAPTAAARAALLAEGVAPERVHVTGNTVVDALQRIAASLGEVPPSGEVLITVHRRESFGAPLAEIFAAIAELAERFPATRFFYPVHRNPNVLGPAHRALGSCANVELAEPLDYVDLVRRLMACRLVLTDSGGIQEEAPTFGKPVLVLRDTTERPEGIAAGVARLVGTSRERIVAETRRLLEEPVAYRAMATAVQPYGDGRAGERIAELLGAAGLAARRS